jgi:hypothetical protein
MGWTATGASVSVSVPKGTPPGTYQLTVLGTNQGRHVSTNVSVNVVVDLPTAKAPALSFIPITRMGLADIPVRISWPAATDPSSAIAGYEIGTSESGGAWSPSVALGATHEEMGYTLRFATSYRFRVRAVDAAGNWSPWVTGEVAPWLTPVDDRSASIARSGAWNGITRTSAYGSTLLGSTQKGASLSFTFTGHAIALVGPRSLAHGRAQVYVDGVYIKTINMRTKSSTSRIVAFARAFAGGGKHSIRLVVIGKAPARLFRLDAFVVSK